MAIEKAGNAASPKAAPQAEPNNQKNVAKKPDDYTAAKTAPKETKAAAKTAFGNAPKGADAKTGAGNGQAAAQPKEGAKTSTPPAPQPKETPAQPTIVVPAGPQPKQAKLVKETGAKAAPAAPQNGATTGADSGAKAPAKDTAPKTAATVPSPPAEPADDPKQPGYQDLMALFPSAGAALTIKDEAGKTVIENAQTKTLQDLKAYAEAQAKSGQPPDAISQYYRYKLAETAAKLGLPTGSDPKDPRMPKTSVYASEKTTGDIFDMEKIKAGVKTTENDPVVQEFLSSKQQANADAELERLIGEGKIPDVPKDPQTGSRAKYLADAQRVAINDPTLAASIAKMPTDKQQQAIGEAVGPLAAFGVSTRETKGELVNLINKVADLTGQHKPLVDANNDFVLTPQGNPVVLDPDSGRNIALDKNGKPLTDAVTKLPKAIGNDGKEIFLFDKTVVIAKSGDSVILDKSGNLQVLTTDRYGNENVPLTNPNNQLNRIIIDKTTNAPVELDAKTGKAVTDEQTGLAKVINTRTGLPLVNPGTGNAIVADTASTAAVEVDKATGKIVSDTAGNTVVVDPKTGYQLVDRNNNWIVSDKESKLPVTVDPVTGIKTVMNPKTAAPLVDPSKGTTIIIDPGTKMPAAALTNRETGALIRNPNGQVAQLDPESGLPVVVDPATGTRSIVNAATGLVVQDPNGNALQVDKASKLPIATAAGKDVVEPNSGAKILYDHKTGLPLGKPQAGTWTVLDPKTGIPVEVNNLGQFTPDRNSGKVAVMNAMSGQNLVTVDGKQVVIDPKSNLATVDNNGRTFVVNPLTAEYVSNPADGVHVMLDPATNVPVYIDPLTGDVAKDKTTGGLQVADPRTGQPLTDPFGSKIQVDPNTGRQGVYNEDTGKIEPNAPVPAPVLDENGGQVTLPNGLQVAKDGASGNTILVNPITKQPVTDQQSGLVQIVTAAGAPLLDAAGNKVVIDKDTGSPVAVNAAGKVIVDPKGNALVLNGQTGKQVADAAGNPVVLDQLSGAPVMTDKATGTPLADPVSGLIWVADKVNGGAVVDKTSGNTVVLDKESKAPVLQGADGKVVQDAEGNPVMANAQTGKAATDTNGNQIMVDKNVGVPFVTDAATGEKRMVDGTGAPMKEPKTGATFMIGKNGMPQAVLDKDGTRIVIDPATGQQALDGNGNPVYVDSTTGMMVVDSPNGMVDVFTGKAPVVGPPTDPSLETRDKIFKAVRNSIGSVYWGTFGVAGADFALKNTEFFKNTSNFHASRMIASMSGVTTMVMAALRWAPGTKQRELLDQGSQQAGMQFGEDISAVFKYFGFYPKTVDGFVKYFNDSPVAGSNMVLGTDKNGTTIIKTSPASTVTVNAGGVNPLTGQVMPEGGAVPLPAGFQASIFLKKNQVNPLTGAKAAQSGWIDLPNGTYDPAVGLAGYGTTPPPGGAIDPTKYSRFAANSLTKAVSTAANFAMGAGNTAGGILQLIKGGNQIKDGIAGNNGAQIAEGVFNIMGGTAFTAVGLSGVVSAVDQMGTIGKFLAGPIGKLISKVASPANIAGVGLFVANFATAIAGIIGLARDPKSLATTHDLWADTVLDTFKGADVFNGGPAAAKPALADWYKNFAHPYYNEKMKQQQDGDYSQDGSNPNNAGLGIVPNGAQNSPAPNDPEKAPS